MNLGLNNIYKSFEGRDVLQDITINFKTTGCVGLLGPNGPGKTTLMKIILGLELPDSGEVLGFYKDHIGYLSERNPLYEDMYVNAYLDFHASVRSIPADKVYQLCERLELDEQVRSQKIKSLSKGYRQRVGLAAAMIHEPKVLILDEPTSGLDPNQLFVFRQVIKDYAKEHLVLISSHIMQEIEAICDRVLFMKDGLILEDKNTDELLDNAAQTIEVGFDYKVENRFFEAISGLIEAKNITDNVYRLVFDAEVMDIYPKLMEFSKENGLQITSFQIRKNGLESLFIKHFGA